MQNVIRRKVQRNERKQLNKQKAHKSHKEAKQMHEKEIGRYRQRASFL